MPKFKKKLDVVEAVQWDGINNKIVFVAGKWSTDPKCFLCGKKFSRHGFVVSCDYPVHLCPGDWIITDVEGEVTICRGYEFEETYEPVED